MSPINRSLFALLLLTLFAVATPAQARLGPAESSPSSRQKIYALRLKPGQDLRVELEKFTKTAGLQAGYIITCVGSLNRATLRLANQSESTVYDGKFEIVALVGTLTPDGPHLHLSVSDGTGKTLGGHLLAGCPIYTTAEIIIGEAQDLRFTREPDEQTGYNELKIRPRPNKSAGPSSEGIAMNPVSCPAQPSAGFERATHIAPRYQTIRQATEKLIAPLTPEDCVVQSMPDCSPAKWHLAHTSWFFETFVLASAAYRPFNEQFRMLFNSYYQTVGAQYSRPQRELLTRPSLAEVLAYRRHVDEHVLSLLASPAPVSQPLLDILELGLQHEQQHQELLLTDIKHLFSFNPLHPAYQLAPGPAPAPTPTLGWRSYEEGLRWVGYSGSVFSFDNEQPRHRVFLDAYALATRLTTNREYLEFMQDGGYEQPQLWLSDGWKAVQEQAWRAPLYWQPADGQWCAHTLNGFHELNLDEPVCHLSYYEADAYARWAGARLPREAEWEGAAAELTPAGNFAESGLLHPRPAVSAASNTPVQMFGDAWEWTQSDYAAYPGYQPSAGALGEYNGKFMCNQFVLRGGSCVTPQSHIRATYRNFFPPDARWQFSGVRLARDV